MGDRKIKCVVWDLDNTIWDGVLTEDKNVHLKDGVVDIIKELDKRGILQSIASKNNFTETMEKLKEFDIDEYFIYPEINWNPKSSNIKNIAKSINISLDTIAFIDDQEFELEEVKYGAKEVLTISSSELNNILDMDELNPKFITEDSKNRRMLYMTDIKRNNNEKEFEGTSEEFLSSLGLKFTVGKVKQDDLKRAEELTVRTHQLNATGYTYSYEELEDFSKLDNYEVLIAELSDKFGTYGKIGLALVEKLEKEWTLKLMLMSCRVMSRGVGSVLLNHIKNKAKEANVDLKAEFVPTDRNKIMYITYKFGGFEEVDKKDGIIYFKSDYTKCTAMPNYITFHEEI